MKKVALLFACSLIASCSTSIVTKYQSTTSAKSLTNSEVAILETRPSTWILSIDDEPMAGVWHWGSQIEVVATKVTPGDHVLMLREVTDRGSTRNSVALRVRVKAGTQESHGSVAQSTSGTGIVCVFDCPHSRQRNSILVRLMCPSFLLSSEAAIAIVISHGPQRAPPGEACV